MTKSQYRFLRAVAGGVKVFRPGQCFGRTLYAYVDVDRAAHAPLCRITETSVNKLFKRNFICSDNWNSPIIITEKGKRMLGSLMKDDVVE